jgi:hypothetical protein
MIKLKTTTEREKDIICLMQGYLGIVVATYWHIFPIMGWRMG